MFVFLSFLLAANTIPDRTGGVSGSWEGCLAENGIPTLRCIPIIFQNLIQAALFLSGVVALFYIIYAGFQYINSGGDAKTVEGAQKTLTYAIIGLVIVLLSFFIVNFIAGLTGTDCIKQLGFEVCK